MPDLTAELTAFMTRYERATNSHDIDRVAPLIAEDATYWTRDRRDHQVRRRGVADAARAPEFLNT
ncbi:hypothetical protein OG607_29050 [Streptomyces sp. NBC_01537]|uniref:hypothetical protein n=1 Tax=Streptomyces sp. NBC_01537 TaxID=2903896 RepID=UPI003864F3AC